jgi:hypothetical protein
MRVRNNQAGGESLADKSFEFCCLNPPILRSAVGPLSSDQIFKVWLALAFVPVFGCLPRSLTIGKDAKHKRISHVPKRNEEIISRCSG